MYDQSLECLEFSLEYPLSGAFRTINPTIEIRKALKLAFDLAFGSDIGSALRWSNNRKILQGDLALELFDKETSYQNNYHAFPAGFLPEKV